MMAFQVKHVKVEKENKNKNKNKNKMEMEPPPTTSLQVQASMAWLFWWKKKHQVLFSNETSHA